MNRVLKDNRMRSFILRNEKIVAIFIIILSIAIVLPRAHLIKIFLEIKRIDFYYYWIMARMFLSNSNPYNQDLFFSTLQIFDPGQGNSVMPYYPPWILPILTPLGLLPYSIGHLVWFGISLYLLFYIILHAWNYYRGKPSKRWVALLIIIIYYPIIFALYQGQATILVFIGLAGFIFAMIKGKDYIAGIFLILLTVKPHIVYLVLFSILVIVLLKRQWKVIAGGTITWTALILIALLINPSIFNNYIDSMRSSPPTKVLSVSFYGMLSGLSNKQILLSFYIPMIVGILISSIYLYANKRWWDWLYHLNVPIILSILTTPYSWIQDEMILLIPIIYILVLFTQLRSWKFIHYLIFLSFIVLNGLAFKFNNFTYPAHLLFWIPFGYCTILFISIYTLLKKDDLSYM